MGYLDLAILAYSSVHQICAPKLLDCKGISCIQPSSGLPTDCQWDSGLGSAWAIPKRLVKLVFC